MIATFSYDTSIDPPAPVIPVRIAAPGSEHAILLPMLVDTGADCTLVPIAVTRPLGLPKVDVIAVTGVGGARRTATVYAAWVEIGDLRFLARVVGFLDEAILGRDILNQTVLGLDGPTLTGSLRLPSRPRKRRPR